MRQVTKLALGKLLASVAITTGLFLICAVSVDAQTSNQGQNAVYNPSGACCAPSPAFIDASMFGNSKTDICRVPQVRAPVLGANLGIIVPRT